MFQESQFAAPPVPLTPLIGRSRDLAALIAQLNGPATRVLTITGPGGVGKTRLALAAAQALLPTWPDGIRFVALAAISDADDVLGVIARSFGFEDTADVTPFELLSKTLQSRQTLLILDNAEQVEAAGPALAALLTAAPRVRMLVTSRVALHIRGEREFPLDPIALPPAGASSAALADSDAVALFLALSPVSRDRLIASDADVFAIVEICRRLDGLPLAIELAAARASTFPPRSMLARLERRLPMLTGGPRDLPERQRTLRGAIAWSYALLTASQQRLFRITCVFQGATFDGLTAVAGEDESISDDLSALIHHSLVRLAAQSGETVRYVLLETIREYGVEESQRLDEATALRVAHARFFATFSERAAAELSGPDQAAWLRRIDLERDNLIAALDFAVAQADQETALSLAWSMGRYWLLRGHLREGRERVAEALSIGSTFGDANRARALTSLGALAEEQGDHQSAIAAHDESLAISRRLDDRYGIARATNNLGLVFLGQNQLEDAKAFFRMALDEFEKIGNQPAIAVTLINSATVAERMGETSTAERLLARALVTQRALGDQQRVALTLQTLGLVAAAGGELQRAEAAFQEAISIWEALDDHSSVARTLAHLGRLARLRGESEAGAGLLRRSLTAAADQQDDQLTVALSCLDLLVIAWQRGELETGARLLVLANASHDWRAAPLRPDERADYDRAEAALDRALSHQTLIRLTQDRAPDSVAWAIEQAIRFETPATIAVIKPPPHQLTARELEVLKELAQGKTDREIGDELFISHRTVMRHVTSILEKLEVPSRTAAAALAVRESLA